MWLRMVLIALIFSGPAHAQISPTGPPHDAPPADTMQPKSALSEDDARQSFASHGYPNVHDLARSSDGGWTGTAMTNGRSFTVHLSQQGEIERRD